MRDPVTFRRSAVTFVALVLTAACGSVEADPTNVPYWQWWYPECGSPGAPCSNPSCAPVQLLVSDVGGCEYTNTSLMTGCVPGMPTDGWTTYTVEARQLVASQLPPYSFEDVTSCLPGLSDLQGNEQACCTWFDAGRSGDASEAGDAR